MLTKVIASSRRGIHGQVVNILGERILRGELQPGDTIETTALLAELQVSRTVLREAIKLLSGKGLVDARPRFGTYVTERSRWQLLDSDVMTWRSIEDPDPLLVIELGEVRQIIEPAAARMAAVRRSDVQLQGILDALVMLENSKAAGHTEFIEADLAFHRAVLQAAGNELLERFEVILSPAMHARDKLAFGHGDSDFVAQHDVVFQAIALQDPDAAYAAMKELTNSAWDDTAAVLQKSADGREVLSRRTRAL